MRKSLLGRTARYTVPCERDGLVVEIVGKRPTNEPYIWIGEGTEYRGSLNEDAMRLLGTAIKEALGE